MGERITIVGYRDVSFTDDSGRQVEGRSYYFNGPRDNVIGQIAGKLFVSTQQLSTLAYQPLPGDDVIVYYNRYGKVGQFEPVNG